MRNYHAAFYFMFPPTVHKTSNFSTSSPRIVIFCFFFNSSHLNGYKVISHCGFDLYFINDEQCCASFIVFMDIFISSSEKCLFKSKGKLFLCSQYFLHQMCGRFFPTPTNFSVLRTLTECHVKKSFIYVMVYFWPLFSFHWSICLSLCHDYTILVIVAL